ncbi:hypothetical protein LWI28_021250 [Acer negundo]|uniref:Uncharacterized protein n=1 Tax=Acer negundo TaxID=4023 RepID=A0AAD5IS04_ACENE|nr:hypothetical protein LWI28_021250 [Acer negundo]
MLEIQYLSKLNHDTDQVEERLRADGGIGGGGWRRKMRWLGDATEEERRRRSSDAATEEQREKDDRMMWLLTNLAQLSASFMSTTTILKMGKPPSTSHATQFSDLTLRFPLKLFSNLILLRRYSTGCSRLDSSLPDNRKTIGNARAETWSGCYSSARSCCDQIELFLAVEFVNNG